MAQAVSPGWGHKSPVISYVGPELNIPKGDGSSSSSVIIITTNTWIV